MHSLRRRDFLKTASVAGGAVMAAAPRALGANDRLRAAVIGLGGRGRDHMNELAKIPGVEVAVFCDPDEEQMAKRAAEFESAGGKRPKLVADLRRVMEDREIDFVTVASCNHWHALTAIWACQAGKHVYVEKPVAHDIFEGRQMVAAARRYNRVVQGGTQRRSSGTVRKAIQALREGVIGEMYMARCIHYQQRDSLGFKSPEPPPSNLHWDLWLGPAPEQPFHRNLVHYNWHWFWDFGNGEIGNNGIHFMDVARWGLNERLPVRIHSTGGRFGYRDQGQTPNTQVATFDFESGKQLVCEIRGRYTNQEGGANSAVFFYGSEGHMVIDHDVVSVFRGKSTKPEPGFGKSDGAGDAQISHFRNFVDAIRADNRGMLSADIEETYLSTVLPILGNISYRVHRSLQLDPQSVKFVGDAEADRMLMGTYRKPFNVPEKV